MKEYTKREFLKMSLLSFAGVMTSLPALAFNAKKANANRGYYRSDEPINWEAFLDFTSQHAKKLMQGKIDEQNYVDLVAHYSTKLNLEDAYLQKSLKRYKDYRKGKPDFTAIMHKQYNFEIYLIGFEKGEAFEPHDHPDMTGITTCVTGTVNTKTYELLPEKPDKQSFLLKELSSTDISKGEYGTLTSLQRNIHRIEGKTYAQLLDIFTPPYDVEIEAKVKNFIIEEENFENRSNIHRVKLR
ncbi:MAG: hypothetical protein JJT94_05085 [Bernardetiaceae bacterium]|nr:hypothetical protein [Bernardetiaceae bacterium]